MDQNYALSYSPITENASGDLALADAAVFNEAGNMRGVFLSPEEAITAWVCGMNNQGVDLVELPRRRGFGLVYSACPKDGGRELSVQRRGAWGLRLDRLIETGIGVEVQRSLVTVVI